jgi:diguanylate cyclase (GGDEF)-like protein
MIKGELNILIVDDDQDDVLLAEQLLDEGLKGVSLHVDKAHSFNEGLNLAQKTPYDLLLLDYQLGQHNGLDLMLEMRTKGIDNPVVFLTGRGDEALAAEAMRLGAADYLPKSQLTETLARRSVRYAIELHEKELLRTRAEEELRKQNLELENSVKELARMGRESTLLNNLTTVLNTCLTVDEACVLMGRQLSEFFPSHSGGLYLFNSSRTVLEAVAVWGERPPVKRAFAAEECWGLRRGRPYAVDGAAAEILCPHLNGSPWAACVCVPLMAHGETLGIVTLQTEVESANSNRATVQWQFPNNLGEHLALSLANLKLRESLHEQAVHDSLTGLFNRRYMKAFLEKAASSASRHKRALLLVMLDMDHFKRFNDAFGHQAGDKLLRSLAQFLHVHTRGEDIACRYGGDESVLILQEVALQTALERAEQLRVRAASAAAHADFPWDWNPTFSVGVAAAPEHGYCPETLLRIADTALYQAKAQGRDLVLGGERAIAAVGSSTHLV